jgi:hypothetical protein
MWLPPTRADLAELLEGERHQLVHVLRRRGAGAEAVPVTDATLVLRVVEVERVEPLEHRPDGLARRRRDAGVDDGHALLGGGLGGELRVELDVGLRVVADELQLPPQQSAGGVDLLDGVAQAVDHRPAVDVQASRQIVDARHLDDVGLSERLPQHGGSEGDGAERCAGSFEKSSTVGPHGVPPGEGGYSRGALRGPSLVPADSECQGEDVCPTSVQPSVQRDGALPRSGGGAIVRARWTSRPF